MNIFNPDTQGSDPQGRFIDRNVAAGIFGTVLNATVFNQIGDENDNLIKAAGLTPSDKEVNQWLKAIQKLYGDADTVLKEELVRKIEALTASDIAFDDSIGISASDVQNAIVALHTLIKELKADEVSFDDSISLGVSNVQELGVKLNEKLNTEINNLQTQIDTLTIADGEEHYAGWYYIDSSGGRKKVYYIAINLNKTYGNGYHVLKSNMTYVDKVITLNKIAGSTSGYLGGKITSHQQVVDITNYGIEVYTLAFDNTKKELSIYISSSHGHGQWINPYIYFEYTKTTDSLII
ncbi:hypothetical protein [Brachyspira alvinipulli]|uniref:hypothetical protein n=1 Tax=Brachyspira alvinipulli TaxID=84379 RepID=UPI000482D629|nr:hypothetical protein [Brachyspira alvinipulli]